MNSDLYSYLVTKFNHKSLSENIALKILLANWETIITQLENPENKKYNFDFLLDKYDSEIQISSINSAIEIKNNDLTDFRIKNILIHSVRGIGTIKNFESKIPYGINFSIDDSPINAVIIGSNGSGKSSIFSAIEKIYTGNIGEKQFRQAEGDYLQNKYTNEKPFCVIETESGSYSLSDPLYKKINLNKANPDSCFISEYDIFNNSRLRTNVDSNDLSDLVAAKIGLLSFLNLREYLYLLNIYRRTTESSNYKKNIDRQKTINESIKKYESEIKKLENEKKQSINSLNYSENNKELLNYINNYEILNTIEINTLIETFNQISNSISKLKLISVNKNRDKIAFYQQGLKYIDEENNCPYCRKSELSVQQLKLNIEEVLIENSNFIELNDSISQYYSKITIELSSLSNQVSRYVEQMKNDLNLQYNSENFEIYKKKVEIILRNTYLIDEFKNLSSLLVDKNNFYISSIRDNIFKNIDSFLSDKKLIIEIENMNELLNIRNELFDEILPKMRNTIDNSTTDINFIIRNNKEIIGKLKNELVELEQNEQFLKDQFESYQNIKISIGELHQIIDQDIQNLIRERIHPLKKMIEESMIPFLQEDNVEIEIASKDKITIQLCKNGYYFSPKDYFNNARYKIFCGALAIAIAIASRITSGLNIPLILDDEFFDCDITNRLQFESFLKNVIDLYYKLTPEMPLQCIIFTHDELIFESAKNAFSSIRKNPEYRGLVKDTIYGRLFPSNSTSRIPMKYNDSEYWSLIHKFNFGETDNA